MTYIGNGAFWGCTSLSSIDIPDSVASIGESAFDECEALTSVIIPEGVERIDRAVFYGCKSLKYVEIPKSVQIIDEIAFQFCTALEQIYMPAYVKYIDDFAFDGCQGITDVYYAGTEDEWHKIKIGYANDALTDAALHCRGGFIIRAADNSDDSVKVIRDGSLITVSGSVSAASPVFVASFDKFGLQMKGLKVLTSPGTADMPAGEKTKIIWINSGPYTAKCAAVEFDMN